jgi:hypothetical protein
MELDAQFTDMRFRTRKEFRTSLRHSLTSFPHLLSASGPRKVYYPAVTQRRSWWSCPELNLVRQTYPKLVT